MTEAQKNLVKMYQQVYTNWGAEMLISIRLAPMFLQSCLDLHVALSYITCWEYKRIIGGIVGIAEEYPYNYWVPEVIEGYTDRVEGSVALIRQHIQTLPSHIDLLGFDLVVP
jgi:hypothetical protein